MTVEMKMPEMGEGVIEGTIGKWLKEIGDTIDQFEPLVEIETDKVTTEAVAEMAGVLRDILVQEGETVPVGTILAMIEPTGGAQVEPAVATPEPVAAAIAMPAKRNGAPAISSGSDHLSGTPYRGRISPVVGRIADEHDVNLDMVHGTGKNGRITKRDILAYVDNLAPVTVAPTLIQPAAKTAGQTAPKPTLMTEHGARKPTIAAPTDNGDTVVPLTNMRRAIAEHMVRSKANSPHVTTVFEFDFTAVAKHRAANKALFAKDGVNLTFTAYLVAATVMALKQHPMVNSSWSDDGVVQKRPINIGMAAAVPEGLIVPVIKGADALNLLGLTRTINELTARARAGKLTPSDVQGGTFTITNHGVSGSLFATPIINQPQCGILGAGKIEKRVKVINDAIAIRPMAYVSFTFDHRILDGASADGFVGTIKQIIENWS